VSIQPTKIVKAFERAVQVHVEDEEEYDVAGMQSSETFGRLSKSRMNRFVTHWIKGENNEV